MYRFKEYTVIAEGKTAGAEMEKVIAVCSELYPKGKETFYEEILTRPEIKLFLSLAKKPFSVVGLKINNETDAEKLKKIFFDFGKVINQKTRGNIDAGAGQSKPEVSTFWTEITEKKKDTSKADIMIGRNKVSVKAPVAQIMSGKKKETKATVLAAAEASGLQKSIQKSLFAEIDKFVESTETNSKKINVTVLKKM